MLSNLPNFLSMPICWPEDLDLRSLPGDKHRIVGFNQPQQVDCVGDYISRQSVLRKLRVQLQTYTLSIQTDAYTSAGKELTKLRIYNC